MEIKYKFANESDLIWYNYKLHKLHYKMYNFFDWIIENYYNWGVSRQYCLNILLNYEPNLYFVQIQAYRIRKLSRYLIT